MMGRCERCLTAATAERSSVLRVYVSYVRMPRSQSTTSGFPSFMIYSAALSHSSSVAARPRFKSTGLPDLPTALSSPKFCMLRAPICSMSAYAATRSTASTVVTSVTTLSPVRSRASARNFSPCSSSPWKEYGLVRGLYAPPRRNCAPAFFTISAASKSCSRDSTAHGPDITTGVPSPIFTPATSTTLERGWNSRLASL